jgi:hypothetical protein
VTYAPTRDGFGDVVDQVGFDFGRAPRTRGRNGGVFEVHDFEFPCQGLGHDQTIRPLSVRPWGAFGTLGKQHPNKNATRDDQARKNGIYKIRMRRHQPRNVGADVGTLRTVCKKPDNSAPSGERHPRRPYHRDLLRKQLAIGLDARSHFVLYADEHLVLEVGDDLLRRASLHAC